LLLAAVATAVGYTQFGLTTKIKKCVIDGMNIEEHEVSTRHGVHAHIV